MQFKDSEIMSEQVLAWARRVKTQRVKNAPKEARKDNKVFDAINSMNKRTVHLTQQN